MNEWMTITNVWNFETASQFVQSLAKQAAWRAFHSLSVLNVHMSCQNGSEGYVAVSVTLPGKANDFDPPDATNLYAKPYDDALAGHLRNAD